MTHPEHHDLTALAYGLVESPERESLLEHVHLCDSCRELYDSMLEEQALVRQSLHRDARSGAAEARALERALLALQQTPTPNGGWLLQLARRVTWPVVGRVAALLIVALGLMVLVAPRPAEVMQVSQEQRAPVNLVSGRVLAPGVKHWHPVDAVPANEWVMCAEESPAVMSFDGGSVVRVEPGSVFRLLTAAKGAEAQLDVLRGSCEYVAGEAGAGPVLSGTRMGEFRVLPGSKVDIVARWSAAAADARQMRSYLQAEVLELRMASGEGFFHSHRHDVMPEFVAKGEGLRITPERIFSTAGGGMSYSLQWQSPKQWSEHMQSLQERSSKSAGHVALHPHYFQLALQSVGEGEIGLLNHLQASRVYAGDAPKRVVFREISRDPNAPMVPAVPAERLESLTLTDAEGKVSVTLEPATDGLWTARVLRDGQIELLVQAANRRELIEQLPAEARSLFTQARPAPAPSQGSGGGSSGTARIR